jgi:simple sugar transport system substrate-binding protein
MTDLQSEFGTKGSGYAGVDLYAGGTLTANAMLAKGLKSGDEAMVYGVFSQAERGQSEKGLADTLEKAGLKVDRFEVTQEVNSDVSLGVPVLSLHSEPSQAESHRQPSIGGITGVLAEALEKAGRKPARSWSAASILGRQPSMAQERLCHRHS